MAKMGENGREMAENGQKWEKNGRKWPKMAKNGQKKKRAKMAENGRKWPKNGRKWPKIAKNGRKMGPKMAENGRKWPKMANKWPKMAKNEAIFWFTKVSFWASTGLLSLILALFWAHWAANALFWDLTSIKGPGVLFLRRSRALCFEKWRAVPYTAACLERKWPKKGLKWPKSALKCTQVAAKSL